MISKEILKKHYEEYASQPDEWVANMEITKRSIIKQVLQRAGFEVDREPVKVVVLGASDVRYLPIHERIFRDVLKKKIEMRTLDVDTSHLGGESDQVITHDVTQPFPGTPNDIVFSHELLKFLTPDEQLQAIINSYQALNINGLAMHIVHEPSIKGTSELRSWQYRVSPDDLVRRLKAKQYPTVKLIFESQSTVPWLRETTVIVLQKEKAPDADGTA